MKKAELQKLRERVKNDPKSTLFVALAEEYRKAGMFDEAISVLEEGLSRQPNYSSARVALGKIFFEKSMLDSAREEFEKVVELIPDNLFARQRLADIYEEQGLLEKAREQVDAIIKLNPNVFDGERFRNNLGPKLVNAGWAAVDASGTGLQGDALKSHGESTENLDLDLPQENLEGDMDKSVDRDETVVEPQLQQSGPTVGPEGAPDSGVETLETSGMPEAGAQATDLPAADATASGPGEDKIATESLARLYIQQNHYDKALDVYEKLYMKDPENKTILQELSDLKALMAIMGGKMGRSGNDREKTISRLNLFLEKIRDWGGSVS